MNIIQGFRKAYLYQNSDEITRMILNGERLNDIKRALNLGIWSEAPQKKADKLSYSVQLKCKCGKKYGHDGDCKGKSKLAGYSVNVLKGRVNQELFQKVRAYYIKGLRPTDAIKGIPLNSRTVYKYWNLF